MASNKDDDGVINLKSAHEEAEFRIDHIDEETAMSSVRGEGVTEFEGVAMKPHDKVKIKFDKFVNLVATHAYEDIFEKHTDQDVIISTDLLADLANAHEEKPDKKGPMVFIGGILLGLVLAWILLKT